MGIGINTVSAGVSGVFNAASAFVGAAFVAPFTPFVENSVRTSLFGESKKVCEAFPQSVEKIANYASWAIDSAKSAFSSSYDYFSSFGILLPVKNTGLFNTYSGAVRAKAGMWQSEGVDTCREILNGDSFLKRFAMRFVNYSSQVLKSGEDMANHENASYIFGGIALAYAAHKLFQAYSPKAEVVREASTTK